MKLNLFALLAFSIYLTSCQKEESSYTEVSGIVFTKGTSDPIANALVSLEWWDPAVFGETRYYVDSTRTNSAGEFTVSGDLPEYQEYYVIAHADKHFETETSQRLKPNISRGKKQNLSLPLTPYSWIKMNIRKTLGNDYLRINSIHGGNYGYFSSSNDVFYSTALGNRTIEISCFRIKDGIQSTAQYYVYTIGQDTVEVNIEF
tara:strand:+ start:1479 stop:2087 length:609 start_codon:yes stop_codon:yes gene_type:complete